MVFFRALALTTLVLHGPKDVVHMNTTPEEEKFLQTDRAKISNTNFGNATSLFQRPPDNRARDICSGPTPVPTNVVLSV